MFISVIIPTYNRRYLKYTIISLQEQIFPKENYEIIVVDNNMLGDINKIVEECNKKNKKEVLYIEESRLGLHNARHTGAKVAKGEILAYVDDDGICDPYWLSELIKLYVNSNVGCVGGKIIPKWECESSEWINKNQDYHWMLALLDLGNHIKELETPEIYGCNFSIRKALLFEVGGFNPDAFNDIRLIWFRGDGETGLLRKVKVYGKKIMYTPYAIIEHVIPKNRLTLNYLKNRSFKEGITDSFYIYRTHKISRLHLFVKSLFYNFCFLISKLSAYLLKILKNYNYFKLEIISSRYKGRGLHQFLLIYKGNLRKYVRKENWIGTNTI